MKPSRIALIFLALALSCLLALASPQSKPQIRVSPDRVKAGETLMLTGTGFTPNRTVMSYLLKPDRTEYNPLRFRTDERGEFAHKIDTVMLDLGTYQSWVEDEATKVVSDRVRFVVE